MHGRGALATPAAATHHEHLLHLAMLREDLRNTGWREECGWKRTRRRRAACKAADDRPRGSAQRVVGLAFFKVSSSVPGGAPATEAHVARRLKEALRGGGGGVEMRTVGDTHLR